MKAQILKIAGVKSEKEFYKLFPNTPEGEKAFMKKYGKEFKKAQYGATLDKNNNGVLDNLEPMNMNAIGQTQNWADTQGYGNQQMNLGNQQNVFPKPQISQEPDFEPIGHINNPGFGKKQQRASNAYHNQLPFDIIGDDSPEKENGLDVAGNIMGAVTGIKNAFDAHKAAKEQTKKMQTWAKVSDVQKRAGISNAFAEKPENQWFRPDDPRFIHSANEQYNTIGRGTDVISQNGSMIGGNPTQTSNNYGPDYTLYNNLGYEPFDESNNDVVKNYQGGGKFGNFFNQLNTDLGGGQGFMGNLGVKSPFNSMIAGNSTGANLAGEIGSLFGPGVGLATTMFGRMLDKNPGRQKTAQNTMNSNNAFLGRINTAQGITGGLSNMGVGQNGQALQPYEDGGWVSHDWQPQVIASFGGLDEQEVYDYAHEGMDSLRAGGHMRDYTPPSNRAMETYEDGGNIQSYAMGGQLQTHGTGEAETISYNPYMPGSGEMSMLRGPSHKDGGIDISYGNAQNGSVAPQVNAEGGEPIIEMQGGGQMDPRTGQPSVEAVVLGNIPASLKLAKATGDKDLINLFTKYDGKTIKSIGNRLAKDNQQTEKYKNVVSKLVNDSDETADGLLKKKTGEIIELAIQTRYKQNAKEQMKLANWQSAVNEFKDERSAMLGRNISAEDAGKGIEKYDYDPITKDAPLKSDVAKHGAYLRKAQSGETTAAVEEPSITEEQYNNFVKLYEEGKNTKSKKSAAIKNFQHLYHQSFPKEALAAIQKTTKENGLSNKAKAMGLTVEDIASGKDVNKILESNEDEYFGPRTEQYMAKIASRFKKTPELALTPLATKTTPAAATTDKKGIDVVPLKENKLGQFADMLRQFMPQDKLPGIDPRQFAGEYMAMAQNQYEPVPMQQASVQLDPMTRISYQDARNENIAAFRDALRQLGGNQAAVSGLLGDMYKANQPIYGEEFRTNQGLEDKIYGGNRAKVNQNMLTNIGLNVDQMDKQNLALSKTKETNQKAIASIADKYMQHDARNLEYNIKSNLFPTYRYNAAGRINTQGPGFRPNISQVYGGKSNIQEVPVYKADGTIDHYKMQEYDPNAQQAVTKNGGSVNKKNKGSVVKNAKNGSIVKLHKNF
jgi:arginyl-tRNA--protein-N-Asp/Glu arginylyltransferase